MKKAIVVLLLLLLTVGCQKANMTTPAVTAVPAVQAATAPEASAAPAEYTFSFTARTLDDEEVTESVFGAHALTMVNVWASWCPPCRGELAELGELYGKLPENVGFLSVTVDDPNGLQDARDLLLENGCAFPCLDGQASEGLMKGFLDQIMAIPTTVFFDSLGNQVGEMIVGVPRGSGSVSELYLAEIQARLDLLSEK